MFNSSIVLLAQSHLGTWGVIMEAAVAYPVTIAPSFRSRKKLISRVWVRKSRTMVTTHGPSRSRLNPIFISPSYRPVGAQRKCLLGSSIAKQSHIHLLFWSSLGPGKIMRIRWERSSRDCNCWHCCYLLRLPTLFALLSWCIIVVSATYWSISTHTQPTMQQGRKEAKYTHTTQSIPYENIHTKNTNDST